MPIDFTTLVGIAPNSMALSYTKNGLTTDVTYDFSYRLRNKYGWGPFSDNISIRTAIIPS